MKSDGAKCVFHRYRRVLSALGTLLIVVLIFWTVNSSAIVGVSASNRQLPVYCEQRDDRVVAMSFDAAWGNEDTQTLIDILNKYGINTTFFVGGDWVDKDPESVRALAENGNEIMNHSSTHSHFSQLSHSDIIADITACNEKIAELTGVTPTLFRCPYGEYDDHVINAVNSTALRRCSGTSTASTGKAFLPPRYKSVCPQKSSPAASFFFIMPQRTHPKRSPAS